MTDVVQFALLGFGAGAIYALLGQGLVLIYRGSGVLNLAHGAFAMAGAFLYYELHTVAGQSVAVSILGAVASLALAGVATDQLLLRRLRRASAIPRVIARPAFLGILQGLAVLRSGPNPALVEPLFAPRQIEVLGATVSAD